MKKLTCLALVAALALGAGAAHAFPNNFQSRGYGARFLNFAGYPTDLVRPAPVDSLPFTIITGTGNNSTDTSMVLDLSSILNQGLTNASTNVANNYFRLTVQGQPTGVAVDTIYAWVEGCADNAFTCWSPGAVTPQFNLLAATAAGATDTTLTRRGGYILYSAIVTVNPTTSTVANPEFWRYVRFRFRGDNNGSLANCTFYINSVFDSGIASGGKLP